MAVESDARPTALDADPGTGEYLPFASECSACGRELTAEVDRPGQVVCAGCRSRPDELARNLVPTSGYEVVRELGRGGMGAVYLAREAKTGREVALKLLLPEVVAGEVARQRFLREADITRALDHPNVVTFLDRGVADWVPYHVTEWVAGGSLADRMDVRPADPAWAAEVVRDAAGGLGAAHTAGVIHRDVKPGNILLGKDEGRRMKDDCKTEPGSGSPSSFIVQPSSLVPKVCDFGLARLGACGGTLTASAEVIGTRRYMPPEQLAGRARDVGPWSDLFSLGAVLYELLAGRPAFADIERDTPPPLAETFPPQLRAACERALRPDPRERFQTAAEFVAALGAG